MSKPDAKVSVEVATTESSAPQPAPTPVAKPELPRVSGPSFRLGLGLDLTPTEAGLRIVVTDYHTVATLLPWEDLRRLLREHDERLARCEGGAAEE